ncbi:MAG: AarF/ABC1/UbiB kinase family protein [Deltaproteobacteria bacterium]|nr:AarF/ABC1/UbiB kinase family protein [Deltaproteobacteria bacterium]
MSSPRPSRFRFLRAYWITFLILGQYLFLFLLRKIISEARTEGLMLRTHQKTAKRIVANILKLKGLYIKIGQTLSMMTNFLPQVLTEGLEELQDAVPPHPYEEMKKRFFADFGKSPEAIFKSIEKTPIASASLGQVHVAHAKDDARQAATWQAATRQAASAKLAVKFQYPDIDRIVRQDLKTIRKIFGLMNFIFPNYGLKNIYNECAQMILQELDFEAEGKNLERIRANFGADPKYVFPKVHWNLSSKKILTAEFIDGIKVTNLEALKGAGIDPQEVAVSLIHSYCKQIFIDGVFHADPHPGNIIIIPASPSPGPPQIHGGPPSPQRGEGNNEVGFQVAMVDFGATATLSPRIKSGIALFVEGLIKKDTRVISMAMKEMGFITKRENEETFDRVVEYFYGKIKGIKIDNFREINISQFQHLSDIIELKKKDISLRELTGAFHVPKDWILLERALILMMGLTAYLAPQLNPMDIILPYVEQFVLGKDKKVTDLILQASRELIISYISLPTDLHKLIRRLEEGKISFYDKKQREQDEKLYRSAHQLIYTLLIILGSTMAYLMHREGNMEWVTRLKFGTGFFGLVLFWSLFKNRR